MAVMVEEQQRMAKRIEELEAELAKQEQDEPVAYINVEQRKLEWAKYISWDTPTVANLPKIPLYTQTKEWVELTEYEIKGVLGLSESWVGEDCSIPDMIGFAKAIEAKLKEKNHVVSGQ
jgi:hypothetical protein